ncbi:MAG: response regulator [Desulfobulbaceae bacterium]|nr:response regulator [Desulfobulbaceae bacterium]
METDNVDKEPVKILCVDDEKNILRSLERLFMDDDYEIITASNGEEALVLLTEQPGVQLVIADYRMPGMDGVDFLKQVNEQWPKTIRIVLSGFADMAAIVGAINEGQIYKFIPKPWNDEELKGTIAKALEVYFLRQKNEKLTDELMEAYLKMEAVNSNLEEEVRSRTETLIFQNNAMHFAHKVMDALPAAVVGFDISGLIVLANKQANLLLANGFRTLVGLDGEISLPAEIWAMVAQTNESQQIQASCSIKDSFYQVLGHKITVDLEQEGIILMFIPSGNKLPMES